MTNNNDVQTQGTPIFDRLILTAASGKQYDLAPMLMQLNIYEDMFSPVLTGDITIIDSAGMFENAPITSNEKLTCLVYSWNYSKDNEPINFLHRTFDILSVTDIKQTNDFTKQYTLHFASPELKKNETFRLSRGFTNTTISNVVSKLLTNDYDTDEPVGLGFPTDRYFSSIPQSAFVYENSREAWYQKSDENDCVELFVEKTKYTEPVVSFPYMKCFDVISWLAGRSLRFAAGRNGGTKNAAESANFVFFENKRGFQFTAIETLLESKDINSTKFVYGNAAQNKDLITNGGLKQRTTVTETINRLEIQNSYDTLYNIRSGMYASKLYTYDITTGEIKEHDYDYVENFEKTESTQSGTDTGNFPMLAKNSDLSKKFLSNRLFATISPSYAIDTITSESTERNSTAKQSSGIEEYLQKRQSQLSRLNNFRILFEIAGNTKHKVGDCVLVDIRHWNSPSAGVNVSDIEEESSKYYSGYYLLTSIRHSITQFEYKMFVEGVKDAYTTELTEME